MGIGFWGVAGRGVDRGRDTSGVTGETAVGVNWFVLSRNFAASSWNRGPPKSPIVSANTLILGGRFLSIVPNGADWKTQGLLLLCDDPRDPWVLNLFVPNWIDSILE